MSSQVEFESFNVTIPLLNTPGMTDMVAILVTQTKQDINLSDYFGGLGEGHFFTAQADGAKVYIGGGFAAGASGINEQAQGGGAQICYPIPDGQQLPFRLTGGRAINSSGYATNLNCASGFIIQAKLALSGVATGFLRIYRSSLAQGQGLEQFPIAGRPNPIPF